MFLFELIAVALVALFACQFIAIGAIGDISWPQGRVVQFTRSEIELVRIQSPWTSDYDYINHMEGPIYFNDCVSFVNRSTEAATHIQFIFAAVNADGELKRPLLPLDIHYRAEPGKTYDGIVNCRLHGYASGDKGLWLVAWVNRVDFADGTSWSAPAADQLKEKIAESLSRSDTVDTP